MKPWAINQHTYILEGVVVAIDGAYRAIEITTIQKHPDSAPFLSESYAAQRPLGKNGQPILVGTHYSSLPPVGTRLTGMMKDGFGMAQMSQFEGVEDIFRTSFGYADHR